MLRADGLLLLRQHAQAEADRVPRLDVGLSQRVRSCVVPLDQTGSRLELSSSAFQYGEHAKTWDALSRRGLTGGDIIVVGIFPNEASITRLIGAVLLEQNDEWLLQCRYMQIEGMAELTPPLLDADPMKLPPMAA